jgi:tetratricopeptide (TPR) repeat protein
MKPVRALGALLLVALALIACGGAGLHDKDYLAAAREAGEDSDDPDRVGEWLMAELVASGGDVKRAAQARERLKSLRPGGVNASLARALDDDVHGRFPTAAFAYLAALTALRDSPDPDAALLSWFAANRIAALRHAAPKLWPRAKRFVLDALRAPGALGWRARGELVDWWSQEHFAEVGGATSEALLDQIADKHGCVRHALMAGPFGRGVKGDHRVHFAAEQPAPWPARFPPDPQTERRANVHAVDRHACLLGASDASPSGVYYVQTFIDVDAPREVLIAVQGAYALFVDDAEVLTRDMAAFGAWPRFAAAIRLSKGRHRILARLMAPETAIRVLSLEGSPLGLRGSTDQSAPYVLGAPERLHDPNALEPFMRSVGVPSQPGTPRSANGYEVNHPLRRYIAAYLAHIEGQDDLASVLLEPLVAEKPTPVALAQQAVFIDSDPIFPQGVARDMARDARKRAAERDPALWGPRLWLVLEKADKAGPQETVSEMEALARTFPKVPLVLKRLANMYAQLGWSVEHGRTVERAAQAFPEDTEILKALLELYEQRGRLKEADEVAARIRNIDPTEEVEFRRAMQRRDYQAAIAELKRIAKLRKDRRDVAIRIADMLSRAGHKSESLDKLKLALEANPTDAQARLALADARFAAGSRGALTDALAEAIRTGSDDGELRSAIELVEGMTDLEPYRRDGLAFIREVQKNKTQLPGTAARILDYAALWVAPDGNARMLEHEIIRVQSREGIAKHAEQQIPRGVVLRMRTIKSDGRIFEPELVSGKPTVTMPHLEVGDYVETESIWFIQGAIGGGKSFRSPRWYFREENVSYNLSEFVVVVPATRSLEIETTGAVPAPTIEKSAGLAVYRWKVTGSPALPEEPFSAPVQEFLPSVRAGWGVDLEWQLRRLMDLSATDTLRDPRMVRIAETIVRGKLKGGESVRALSVDERARRIYRWVLDTVQAGEERDGPKIITGKSGDRTVAFLYLCRLLGIDARLGAVRDRLSPPPIGPFSEAEAFDTPAVRIASGKTHRWLVVQDRYAPYGYMPSSLRGQPAVLLETARPVISVAPPPLERDTTSSEGAVSAIVHEAKGTLRDDGGAALALAQQYHGRYAIQLRSALSNVPEARRKDEVEAKLLGLALPGGRVENLELPNLDKLDEPVELHMQVEVSALARPAEQELILDVPFLGSLEPLVQLNQRQTPLYISERVATRARVAFVLTLPEGAKVVTPLVPVKVDDERIHVRVADRQEGRVLRVSRELDLPAGRVQPDRYAEFRERVLRANEALNRSLRIALR